MKSEIQSDDQGNIAILNAPSIMELPLHPIFIKCLQQFKNAKCHQLSVTQIDRNYNAQIR